MAEERKVEMLSSSLQRASHHPKAQKGGGLVVLRLELHRCQKDAIPNFCELAFLASKQKCLFPSE